MKKHTLLYICSLFIVAASAIMPTHAQRSREQFALYNYRNDGNFNAWLNIDIDSITYSCIDTLGVEHDAVVVQEVWTPDSLYRIPIEAIDSIGFRAPEPEMASDIFYIRDYHAGYTTSIDELTLYFSNTIHRDSIPRVGQVVLSATEMTPYEEGFAGKVVDVKYTSKGIVIVCEAISIGDIYKRLVVVGKVSNDIAERPSDIKGKRYASDPWVNIEEDGVIPIDLKEKVFPIGDILKIISPTPKLTCSYYVYISELWYEVYVKLDLYHPDLTYKFTLTDDNVSDMAEFGKLFVSRFSDEEALSKWIEEYKSKKIKEYQKEQKEEEGELFKQWFEKSKIKIPIPIPTSAVLNLDLEISPILKAKGKFEIVSEFKTDAWQSMSMKWRGLTPTKVIASNFQIPDIPTVSIIARQDPIKDAKLDLKAKGTLTVGFKTLLNANVIHKKLIYAGLACDFAMAEVGGTIDVTILDTEKPEMNLYDRIKDTNLKVSTYAKGYAEVGLSPYKFLSASTPKAEIYSDEAIFYLMPHFTEPALPKFNNGHWESKQPLSLFSYPSKDVFIPCRIGMRIEDEMGNVKKEYQEKTKYEAELDWRNEYMDLDISDLPQGANYKCYPTISFFGWEPFDAGPVHNFTVPISMVASPAELKLEVGKSGVVEYFGGWDNFAVVISGDDQVASIVKDGSTTVRQVKIIGKKVGESELQIEDRRTGEKIKVPIIVTDEPIPSSTISVTPTEIDFGYVPVGSSKTESFTVSNTGTSSLTFTVSEMHNEFDIPESGKEFTLAAGEQKTFSVTFSSSTANQSRGSVVRIFSDAENGTQYLELEGQTYPSTPDVNTPAEAIDLGLPSGTKWASYNLGATKPEGFGGYYAWGELKEKDVYSASTYQHCDGTEESCHNLGNSICGTKYDVATAKWGEGWQMPSHEQFEELINKCTQTTTTLNGIKGVRFTAPNGNSIFIPAAGECFGDDSDGLNDYGDYFTGTQYPGNMSVAYGFYFGYNGWGYEKKWNGHSIRPVYVEKKDVSVEAIDLGLPSGTLWASCNVGATTPEEDGNYYAWGETASKSIYEWSTYVHCDGTEETCHDIGDKISGTQYDAANILWGNDWELPTIEDWKELVQYCSTKIERRKGVSVRVFTGSNGNSIELPIVRNGYWSGDIMELTGAHFYSIDDNVTTMGVKRFCPLAIRPVRRTDTPIEAIDLGLSVKWLSCNVGATKAEEYGEYFAWGETEPKENYKMSSYKWYVTESYPYRFSKYNEEDGKVRLDKEDDAAYVQSSGKYRMPTYAEFRELYDNCSHETSECNGIKGITFKADNGNSIFLPMTGYWWWTSAPTVGEETEGYYWTSGIQGDGFYADAWYMPLSSWRPDQKAREAGLAIRAVQDINTPVASMDISGRNVDFGRIPVNASCFAIITIKNIGKTNLKMEMTTPDNPFQMNAKVFSMSALSGSIRSNKVELLGEDSLIITIYFKPTALGSFSSSIHLKTNASDSDVIITVSGVGKKQEVGNIPVDLGLSVKWANQNMGAESPTEKGDLYAWGETETKEVYDEDNYKWRGDGFYSPLTKYCNDRTYRFDGDHYYGKVDNILQLEPIDDAATTVLGNSWKIPTEAECKELMNTCNQYWGEMDGVEGCFFKGTTGETIFISLGKTWTSTLYYIPTMAYALYLQNNEYYPFTASFYGELREEGLPIRPVMSSDNNDGSDGEPEGEVGSENYNDGVHTGNSGGEEF